MSLYLSKLARYGLLLIVAMAVLAGSAFLSESPDYVSAVSGLIIPIGILGALFCGIAYARNAVWQTSEEKTSANWVVLGFAVMALISLLGTVSAPGLGIAALFFGLLAIASWIYGKPGKIAPTVMKLLIMVGAFIAGIIPGLILLFILYLVVSERYCQLSSSKCM